ncbi:hypothetical protein [Williamsia sp.]|uniref:hypothetical protein n=1 Tax=Williamsia sp. TaxID=1872085 RepID=UPI002F93AA49
MTSSVNTQTDEYQMGLLVAGVAAAAGEGSADAAQLDALKRQVLPSLEAIRNLNRAGNTVLLGAEITKAREAFTAIMGTHWQPNPGGQVAQALKAKGVDPTAITG